MDMDLVRKIFKHLEGAVPPSVPHGHSKERARGQTPTEQDRGETPRRMRPVGGKTLMISPLGLFRIVTG